MIGKVPFVSGLCVVFPDRGEFVPPGFTIVRRCRKDKDGEDDKSNGKKKALNKKNNDFPRDSSFSSAPHLSPDLDSNPHRFNSSEIADFNEATPSTERIYICFRRSRGGNPITSVSPVVPEAGGEQGIPSGYTIVERSVRNRVANLNAGNFTSATSNANYNPNTVQFNSPPLFLAYRQRLAILEPLAPDTLVKKQEEVMKQERSVYFTTGGGAVEADVSATIKTPRGSKQKHQQQDQQRRWTSKTPAAAPIDNDDDETETTVNDGSDGVNFVGEIVEDANNLYEESLNGDDVCVDVDEGEHVDVDVNVDVDVDVNVDVDLNDCGEEKFLSKTAKDNGIKFQSDVQNIAKNPTLPSRTRSASNASFETSSFTTRTTLTEEDDDILDDSGVGIVLRTIFSEAPSRSESSKSMSKSASKSASNSTRKIKTNPNAPSTNLSIESTTATTPPAAAVKNIVTKTATIKSLFLEGSTRVVSPITFNGKLSFEPTSEKKMAVMVPLLTALYNVHGGTGRVALEGLVWLMEKSSFFSDELVPIATPLFKHGNDNKNSNISSPYTTVTLLALTAQIICDSTTCSSRESLFSPAIKFTSLALEKSHLDQKTIGAIVRFYFFVCGYGASARSGSSSLTANTGLSPIHGESLLGSEEYITNDNLLDAPLLSSKKNNQLKSVVTLVDVFDEASTELKNLVSIVLRRVESGGDLEFCHILSNQTNGINSPAGNDHDDDDGGNCNDDTRGYITDIVYNIVNTAVSRVELTNTTQSALAAIARHGGSGGGESFWREMVYGCGIHVFGSVRNNNRANELRVQSFALLAQIIKMGCGDVRKLTSDGRPVMRDLYNKLLSLELLLHYLKTAGSQFKSSSLFGYLIRRLVVNLVLNNYSHGLNDYRVFRRLLKIITALWSNFRSHMKIEIAVLCEHFMLRVLRLGPQVGRNVSKLLLQQQIDVLAEVVRWFDMPHNVVELFLNYDIDNTSDVKQWKICEQICSALCTLAEQCGAVIGGSSTTSPTTNPSLTGQTRARNFSFSKRKNSSPSDAPADAAAEVAARILQDKSLHAVGHIVRSLMDASGHVYMMISDESLREKSSRTGGWDKTENDTSENSKKMSGKSAIKRSQSVVYKQAEQKKTEETLNKAFKINQTKGLKKALNYLTACNFLAPNPREISNFLRVYQSRLDPVNLGDYLSEGGLNDEEYWNLIRYQYVRAISFENLNVEQGLRHFLTNGGFRLPGEAQRIDRLLTTFAQCFWEDNSGNVECCPFSHQDTVYLLAFAVIMLNTDLHKADAGKNSSRKRKKMTKLEFMNNLRGVDSASDLNKDYLSNIYDGIASKGIDFKVGSGLGGSGGERGLTGSLASGEEDGDDDEALENRILRSNKKKLNKGVKQAEELLRGLAFYHNSYNVVGKDTMLSTELIKYTVEATWFHFHGIINFFVESTQMDLIAVLSVLDTLKNALSCCVFLHMDIQTLAFANQLARIKFVKEQESLISSSFGGSIDSSSVVSGATTNTTIMTTDGMKKHLKAPASSSGSRTVQGVQDASFYLMSGKHKGEKWFVDIEKAVKGGEGADALQAIQDMHILFVDLKSSMHDNRLRTELKRVCSKIRGGRSLLNDVGRLFVKEGDLVKRCGTGQNKTYRFFLFNDRLIYTHQSAIRGDYKIHEVLLLSLMKINAVKGRKPSFQINHPRKSFLVYCQSEGEKHAWMHEIQSNIEACVERKMRLEEMRYLESDTFDEDEGGGEGGGEGEGGGKIADLKSGIVIGGDGRGREDISTTFLSGVKYFSSLTAPKTTTKNSEESNNETEQKLLLQLYALFKQSTKGDCDKEGAEEKLVEWRKLKGMTEGEAKAKFVHMLRTNTDFEKV